MAGRFAATPMRQRQGAGQAVGRDVEPGEESAFSPAEA
jgi:hypothetical protein